MLSLPSVAQQMFPEPLGVPCMPGLAGSRGEYREQLKPIRHSVGSRHSSKGFELTSLTLTASVCSRHAILFYGGGNGCPERLKNWFKVSRLLHGRFEPGYLVPGLDA